MVWGIIVAFTFLFGTTLLAVLGIRMEEENRLSAMGSKGFGMKKKLSLEKVRATRKRLSQAA